MGSLTNMLLGQAAPAPGIDDSSLSGLSPEAQAAIRALNAQGGIQTMPATPPPAPRPTPTPAPAQQGQEPGVMGAIANFLMGLLPSTKSLAPQAPSPTPAPLTPEQLAERNRRIAGGQ